MAMPGQWRALALERGGHGVPFYLTLAWVAFEYGRPQDVIPILGVLRVPALIVVLLATLLVVSGRANLRDLKTKLFIALLVVMTFHVPIAVNNFWALKNTQMMAMTFVAYLAIATFVDSMRKSLLFVYVWLATIVYAAVLVLLRGGKGNGAFMTDENDAALAINMMIPVAFFFGLQARRPRARWLWFGLAGVLVVAVGATLSRGGFIGLAAVGVYCWLKAPRKLMSGLAVLALAVVLIGFAPARYWQEVNSIGSELDNPYSTGQIRLYSWKAAWRMFLDHPLLGVGPGNFQWNFRAYEPDEGFAGRHYGGRAAHSLYFTLISELGLAGVIIYSLLLGGSWRDWRQAIQLTRPPSTPGVAGDESAPDVRRAYYLTLALEGSMLACFVTGVFLSVLYYPHFWVLMGLSVALRRVSERAVGETSPDTFPQVVPRMAPVRP